MYESQDREGEAKVGKQTLARVAVFDYSVENFFAAMDSISALCGEACPETFPTSQMERFSSMIIFLKEWRHFCYESKILNFSYETESVRVNKFGEGINLPQFSSAAVPEMEPLPENLRSSCSNDFVLHAGGPVWALDWCPRADENLEDQFKCEYLAVAAHPPGSSYHKIGAPLLGRGLIQIWCILSMDKKEKLS
ncbi:hypothetical protein J5N97_009371 [Dioscorea zingiberensis]|uniref:Uncharacterized protein n=1 Tax=Dioscorea zingiberensis TaxID=325984 RepID=A0A9D5CX25_9LILI|nr:hypothetical protein J5N97_009371 [Dioscorea zingiberensis]